ncbi:FMN-binding negative transcriptional regulator [Planctomicrobium piriforme]|uniref:Transcriptional regulator n=1 Tax=Planctomicrobium piriforme TaxID=1576369 RepID=A0A1I3SJA1_9PLAN|nr:FMN-binding negative transcriptional regulator [Planctomicrobium piriforme]SFJ57547.1 transcriptional regulator [Planctomicrobium piriforme]
MYVPSSFRETDLATLHEFIDRHSFATLISQVGDEPFATHLPLLLNASQGPQGTLSGHMARANSHWQSAASQRVLAIFRGPHAYVSPSWYESPNVVPTWNYVTVHVYGTLRLVDDRSRLTDLIDQMVTRYESSQPTPWTLSSQSEGFVSKMLDAIVGFEIEIDRIEGKWKLSQNHSQDRRDKVMQHLQASDHADDRQIADLMKAR